MESLPFPQKLRGDLEPVLVERRPAKNRLVFSWPDAFAVAVAEATKQQQERLDKSKPTKKRFFASLSHAPAQNFRLPMLEPRHMGGCFACAY